jgi:hypothetical protein
VAASKSDLCYIVARIEARVGAHKRGALDEAL